MRNVVRSFGGAPLSPTASREANDMIYLSTLEEDLFFDALELPVEKRRAFVETECSHDPELAERVLALLRGYEENSAYLETPPGLDTGTDLRNLAYTLPREHAFGERIDHYILLDRIGEGGCGVVYRAEQQEPMTRDVALKIIRLGMDTGEFIERFETEQQALAMMNHPNIARVHDAGATPAGRPYFVMELINGPPITRYCDEHRLPTARRLELFAEVCQAIQHTHQKGIIHRDLKPSNILVALNDRKAVPKIIDFGIAKAVHGPLAERALLTRRHTFIGTPAYTSPEQMERGDVDVDTRSDIYSLGVLLYELLTGQPPFDRETLEQASLEETCRIVREVEPLRPSLRVGNLTFDQRATVAAVRAIEPHKLSPLLRSELDWIVMRCLEKDRKRRYESASALALDIQRYLENQPIVARPPTRSYRFRKFVHRHKTGVAAATAVTVSLITGLVTTGVLLVRERTAHDRALVAERAESQLRQEAVDARTSEARRANRAVIDLANERLSQGRTSEGLAYLAAAARQDPANPTIAPRLASVLAARNFMLPQGPVAEHAAAVLALEYSTDGSHLIAVWEDGTLGRVNLAKGAVEKERLFTPARFGYSRINTKNFVLIYAPDGTIHAINRATGRVQHTLRFENDAMSCRAIDEASDLFFTKLSNNTMMVCDAATGRMIGEPVPYEGYFGAGQKWMAWSPKATNAPTSEILFRRTDVEERDLPVRFPIEVLPGRIATSPDGRRLATVQSDGGKGPVLLRIWSLPEGAPIGKPQQVEQQAFQFYSPDGKFLLCWGNGIEVFDGDSATRIARMPSAGPFVEGNRFLFSPDGLTLATWGNAGAVDLWDLQTGVPRVAPLRHGENVSGVSFSADGKVLLSISDGLARVWNAATGELLAEPTVQLRGAAAVALSPDGSQLTVGTSAGAIHRFRLGEGGLLPLKLARSSGLPAFFLPGTPTRLFWMTSTRARVLDVSSGRDAAPGFVYPERIRAANTRGDGNVAVVQTESGKWQIWWLAAGRVERILPINGAPAELASIVFSPTADRVVLSWAGSMRAWNLETGDAEGQYINTTVNSSYARYANFSPDGQRLLLGSIQGQARIWEVSTGRELVDFGQQPTKILRATYSPDGRHIASGARAGPTQLFDSAGAPIGAPLQHRGMWSSATFSPDSRLFATYSADVTVHIQDVQSGGDVVRSIETDSALWSVRFDSDSKRLVTGTEGGTAQVWNVASGLPVSEPMRHGLVQVRAAEFSPDGRFIRTETAPNGSFYLWSVPPLIPAGVPTPDWLVELATICAGKRVRDDGRFDDTSESGTKIAEIRRELVALPADAPYVEWGRWFLSDRSTRSIAPGFTLSLADASALATESGASR
jgi:eukaryotic-like serine/threonine-protein kinase